MYKKNKFSYGNNRHFPTSKTEHIGNLLRLVPIYIPNLLKPNIPNRYCVQKRPYRIFLTCETDNTEQTEQNKASLRLNPKIPKISQFFCRFRLVPSTRAGKQKFIEAEQYKKNNVQELFLMADMFLSIVSRQIYFSRLVKKVRSKKFQRLHTQKIETNEVTYLCMSDNKQNKKPPITQKSK